MEFREYALSDTLKQLLPILDSLDRALKTEGMSVEDFRSGVELIDRQFHDVLTRLGVEPIAAQGQPFDPNLHQAIQMVETTEVPDHHVIDELQRGYRLRDRVLRAGDGSRGAELEAHKWTGAALRHGGRPPRRSFEHWLPKLNAIITKYSGSPARRAMPRSRAPIASWRCSITRTATRRPRVGGALQGVQRGLLDSERPAEARRLRPLWP